MGDERPAALIFRKRLLPWSETFIAAQGGALERYRPVFVGYQVEQAGRAYLEGRVCIPLAEHALLPPLAKGALKGFGIVAPRWRRAIAPYRPAVVHAHFGVNAVAASALARAFGVPMVVTYHGMDIAIDRNSRGHRREREKVFRRATRIIAVSEFIAGRLRDAGVPERKLVVHHIGVDTARFAPGDEPRAPAEILFVGRLVEKKGLVHLLRAMPRIRSAAPEAELTIAGDGAQRGRLEEEAQRLGVRASWLGVQTPDQVRALMRRATVFCAPSIVARDGNAEGLPMTIVEAQASGLPAVVFPSGGSAEGVADGETGFVVAPRDEAALADRIAELLTDDAKRERFARSARERALRDFDLRKQTAKLETIYDDARATAASG